MSITFVEIGRRLREIRVSTGLSQSEFAEFLGTSFRSYRAYETGDREITSALVLKIEEMPNVPAGWLLAGENLDIGESGLSIIQDTIEVGLTNFRDVASKADTRVWAQKLRLAIKLGLQQKARLSGEDITEILDLASNNQSEVDKNEP